MNELKCESDSLAIPIPEMLPELIEIENEPISRIHMSGKYVYQFIMINTPFFLLARSQEVINMSVFHPLELLHLISSSLGAGK